MMRIRKETVVFKRTENGQIVFDVYFSRMSAPAVVRKWKKRWGKQISLSIVREWRKDDLRKQAMGLKVKQNKAF